MADEHGQDGQGPVEQGQGGPAGGEAGGGQSQGVSFNQAPAASQQGRDQQLAAMRRVLASGSAGAAGDDLFGDEPQDGDFRGLNVGSGEPGERSDWDGWGGPDAAEGVEEPQEEGQNYEALYQQSQERESALAEYYSGIHQAMQHMARQNEELTRFVRGLQATDAAIAQQALEEQQRAMIPDPDTDPRGYHEWMTRNIVQEEANRFRAEQQALAQQQQAQQQQARVDEAIRYDLSDALEQWPELDTAYRNYVTAAQDYYQQNFSMPPNQAADTIRQLLQHTLRGALVRGESPAEALYHLVGAHQYYQEAPQEASQEAPQEASQEASQHQQQPSGAQRFADRAAASTYPSGAGTARAMSETQSLQTLVWAAGNGDPQAVQALAARAGEIGDPRNSRVREQIVSLWMQAPT